MLYFVSDPNSPYYRSSVFDNLLNYISRHPRRCNLREVKGKRSMVISQVETVEKAVELLMEMVKVS